MTSLRARRRELAGVLFPARRRATGRRGMLPEEGGLQSHRLLREVGPDLIEVLQ